MNDLVLNNKLLIWMKRGGRSFHFHYFCNIFLHNISLGGGGDQLLRHFWNLGGGAYQGVKYENATSLGGCKR